jgi:hypothetical protein
MSFFENLAFVMGGDDQIPADFRQQFSDYNTFSASPSMLTEARSSMQSVQPVTSGQGFPNLPPPPPPAVGGIFGRALQGMAGPVTAGFTDANANTITTGQDGNITYNPSASAYGSIDPSMYIGDKRRGASNLSAAVQRAQYQDYLNRFAPVENYLVGQVNGRNTKDLGFDLARANQSVMSAGANMQGQQERAMGRFGLQYRGPSMADSNEITGGRVAAMNQARMADEERALSLVSGSGRTAGGQ